MPGRRKKKRLWIVPLCAVLIAAAVNAALVLHALRSRDGGQSVAVEDGDDSIPASGTIIWEGKEYQYNDHLSNYLLLGIDTREPAETSVGQADAGQADLLWLVSRDRVENTVTVIAIPRDTMTEIEVFGPDGESLGKSVDHISLSYAYGDGSYESCRLAKEAVSHLFYGLPIQGCCALNMDGIPELTESVGTVTVTVPNDSLEEAFPEFQEGVQVTLDRNNTETFVRYRDTDKEQSALARMERQKEYLSAFGKAAGERAAQDPSFAGELYAALEPYMVTGMGKDEFVKLMESASGGRVSGSWTVPGEAVQGQYYDEYHVDDSALYEKIIETFYEVTESGERGETP